MSLLNLKRFCACLVLLAIFLTSCGGVSSTAEKGDITIDGQSDGLTLDVNAEESLVARDKNGKALTAGSVSWNSSDFGVVSVNADGKITAKGSGLAKITASLKSDLSVKAEILVFVPYNAQYGVAEYSILHVGEAIDGDYNGVVTWAEKWGFKIVKSALSASLPWGLVLSLVTSKDQYQFSEVILENVTENVILYEASDWTSGDVTVSLSDVTAEILYERLCAELGIDGDEMGKSFSDCATLVKNVLQAALPTGNTYYFSRMDSSMEYRVVVRGSYQHIHNISHYSNGFLEATGGTVSDIVNLKFGELIENFSEQRHAEEVLNVSGLTVIIECREKVS